MDDEEIINLTDEQMLEYYLDLKEDEIALNNAVHIFEEKIKDLQEELEIMEFLEGVDVDNEQ